MVTHRDLQRVDHAQAHHQRVTSTSLRVLVGIFASFVDTPLALLHEERVLIVHITLICILQSMRGNILVNIVGMSLPAQRVGHAQKVHTENTNTFKLLNI